ncbi:MAG TPA: tetratricopeptide repeat protein [Gemmatimonadaceae bacterium]|nr:tetratricopeptide repeat protein [Gemmatimonadaceae bacterium]
MRILCGLSMALAVMIATSGCDRGSDRTDSTHAIEAPPSPAEPPDEPSPRFRNVDAAAAYVGDAACTSCHARETSVYRTHAMAQSFHRWTPATRVEPTLDAALQNAPTGFSYTVAEEGGRLYQIERLTGPQGQRLHELTRRMDFVMGSGQVARTYFTEENGRLFQLPLTWYRSHGWDFSPGYEINNARFDRLMPDRCVSCHSSYPRTLPSLEGKFAEARPGIGCERCHGPGALHVAERRAGPRRGAYDNTIVNPARLPLERRMDVCEQCHVHTAVTVLREGKTDFSYMPSQALRDQYAFFKVAGTIDIVSHADRLRQSRCFVGTRATTRPLECATCHDPHTSPPTAETRNQPCQSCHAAAVLQQKLARSKALADHAPTANCVSCHMPRVQERAVPHGAFTDHWIRVVTPGSTQPTVRQEGSSPIEPFFQRDRTGPEADVYRGVGGIVYATLAADGRELKNAAAALDASLEGDTTHSHALFLLGVAYQQIGRTDDAIRVLERSVRIDSTHPDRLRALAHAYDRAGRPAALIDPLYRRALALQPALAWVRADYADFLHAQGRAGEARTEYQRALAEQPSLAPAWFDLATLLVEEGERPASVAAFRKAVSLDPSLASALAPLIEIRTTGDAVSEVQGAESPLPTLPMRERGARAVQVGLDTGTPGVSFSNLPSQALVQVLTPDGTLVRALPTSGAATLHWNLLSSAGVPISGGLYLVRVQGRDPSGRTLPPQQIYLGVVRRRSA